MLKIKTTRPLKHAIWVGAATAAITLLIVFFASNLQTPEAKVEHRVPHLYGIRDPQFKREMSVLLGPTILGTSRIQPLQNGDQILPALLTAIRGAKHTIDFETYIYWSGIAGTEFAEALTERALAGVKVHVMFDWLGSVKMDQSLLRIMQAGGVEVERYHALR